MKIGLIGYGNWGKNHARVLTELGVLSGIYDQDKKIHIISMDNNVEYKKETFDLFEELLIKIRQNTILILLNLKIVDNQNQVKKESQYSKHSNDPKCLLNLKKDQKISRNDRCEATGKKYKNCCGATI